MVGKGEGKTNIKLIPKGIHIYKKWPHRDKVFFYRGVRNNPTQRVTSACTPHTPMPNKISR